MQHRFVSSVRRGVRLSLTLALPVVLFALTGCSTIFMGGSDPASEPPESPIAEWTVTACRDTEGNSIELPAAMSYYLADGEEGLVLYEFDAEEQGAEIFNHWTDAAGDHFFTYVASSHAYEFVIPKDRTKPGRRKVFPKETYETSEDEQTEVIKPVGPHSATCEMKPKK
jgi:hypothetical protein